MKKSSKRSKGDGKAAAFNEDEWVQGTPYAIQKRKAAAAANKAA